MKLLCLSNGHGEDAIALRILLALKKQPHCPELAALPMVGTGRAYTEHDIPLIGPVKAMPSGGFIYMDGRQLARDVKGGLLQLTWSQLQAVKGWAKQGGAILAVGDIVPLLFAWMSSAPYAFVGTAKSEYHLRDEAGVLPRASWFEQMESWSGSVYLPWERWLMSRDRCKAVFPRDSLTAKVLKQWAIPAFDAGNPMMDDLEPTGINFHAATADQTPSNTDLAETPEAVRALAFVLLPGSRPPEAYENWQLVLSALAELRRVFRHQPLLFLGAIAPGLDLTPFTHGLEAQGWQRQLQPDLTFTQGNATLVLTQSAFADCLHQADFAIALAGTATEQFVGLGKPAILIPGKGPQFTPAFAEAYTRLLGPSAIVVQQPAQVATVIKDLLQDPDRLQLISENGRHRMGAAGAAQRIAKGVMNQLVMVG